MSSPSEIPMLLGGEQSPDDSLEEVLTDDLLAKPGDNLDSSGNSSDHRELIRAAVAVSRESPVLVDSVHVNVELSKRSKETINNNDDITDEKDKSQSSFNCDSQEVRKSPDKTSDSNDSEPGQRLEGNSTSGSCPEVSANEEQFNCAIYSSVASASNTEVHGCQVTKINDCGEDAAILSVHHSMQDRNGSVEAGCQSDSDKRPKYQLQRQSKMEDASHGSSSPLEHSDSTNISSPLHNSSCDNQTPSPAPEDNVTVEFRGKTKPKSPLKVSSSLGYDSNKYIDSNETKTRLNREERSQSLEVPSIRIKCPDSEEDSTKRPSSSDQSDPEYPSTNPDDSLQTANDRLSLDTDDNIIPSSPSRARCSLPLNYAQRQILSRSVGKSGGNKLKSAYSLDVPGADTRQLSLSLSTLDPNGEVGKPSETFPVVEDKLISSSMPRLEGMSPGQRRRLSWTPDTTPRGSKGSIHGKEEDDGSVDK